MSNDGLHSYKLNPTEYSPNTCQPFCVDGTRFEFSASEIQNQQRRYGFRNGSKEDLFEVQCPQLSLLISRIFFMYKQTDKIFYSLEKAEELQPHYSDDDSPWDFITKERAISKCREITVTVVITPVSRIDPKLAGIEPVTNPRTSDSLDRLVSSLQKAVAQFDNLSDLDLPPIVLEGIYQRQEVLNAVTRKMEPILGAIRDPGQGRSQDIHEGVRQRRHASSQARRASISDSVEASMLPLHDISQDGFTSHDPPSVLESHIENVIHFLRILHSHPSTRILAAFFIHKSTVLILLPCSAVICAILVFASLIQVDESATEFDQNFFNNWSQTVFLLFSIYLTILPPLRSKLVVLPYPFWFRFSLALACLAIIASAIVYPYQVQVSIILSYVASLGQILGTVQLVECIDTAVKEGSIGLI